MQSSIRSGRSKVHGVIGEATITQEVLDSARTYARDPKTIFPGLRRFIEVSMENAWRLYKKATLHWTRFRLRRHSGRGTRCCPAHRCRDAGTSTTEHAQA